MVKKEDFRALKDDSLKPYISSNDFRSSNNAKILKILYRFLIEDKKNSHLPNQLKANINLIMKELFPKVSMVTLCC